MCINFKVYNKRIVNKQPKLFNDTLKILTSIQDATKSTDQIAREVKSRIRQQLWCGSERSEMKNKNKEMQEMQRT